MASDYDPSNPFADPTIVRVQAQQPSAPTTEPKYTFGYNNTEPTPPAQQNVTTNIDNYVIGSAPAPSAAPSYPSTAPSQPSHSSTKVNATAGNKAYNFPYIPPSWTWFPIKPFMYFNIPEEIPTDLQRFVTKQYISTLGYVGILFLNFIASIAFLILGYPNKVSHFLLAFLVGPLMVVLMFVFQYYILYQACKFNSGNYYFWYLIATIGCGITVLIQTIGPLGSGWSGLVVAAHSFDNKDMSIFMGLLSLVIALGFLAYLINILHTAYHARILYMLAKHRELSNAINGQRGGGMTYSIPIRLP